MSNTTTSIESPVCATTCTGSTPPSITLVVIGSASPTRWMVATLPPGAVPAVTETYTTSPPLLDAARAAAALEEDGIGFETITPLGGGGAQSVQGPGESEHAPTHHSTRTVARATPDRTNRVMSRSM